ncbi:MAG: aldo/keto reductase [Chloroflexota bacterium]
MIETTVPTLRLDDGIEIPQLGLGALYLLPEDTQALVALALEVGYRHIDVEAGRGNEEGVGAAIAATRLPREDYFVAVKLCDPAPDRDSTIAAFEASLERLGLDHVDLLLLDRPSSGEFRGAWPACEEIHREEAARTVGVSNFEIGDLELLEAEAKTRPTVNQVELHPWLQRDELRAWHAAHGVVTEAWSPLAQGALLDDGTIAAIAEGHGRTPAQAVLRWHMQLGNVAIPKSVSAERIREAIETFDFDLTDDEMSAIGNLDRGLRIGPDTAEFVVP